MCYILLCKNFDTIYIFFLFLGYLYLSWESVYNNPNISSLQLFAYPQKDGPVDSSLWRKVASLNTPPLPVAVLLRCLIGNRHYHFSIRAVDRHQRVGPFSNPVTFFNKTK